MLPREKKVHEIARCDRFDFGAQAIDRVAMDARKQSPLAPFFFTRTREAPAQGESFRSPAPLPRPGGRRGDRLPSREPRRGPWPGRPGGVDVRFETLRQQNFDQIVSHLAKRGRIVVMAGRDARPPFLCGPVLHPRRRTVGLRHVQRHGRGAATSRRSDPRLAGRRQVAGPDRPSRPYRRPPRPTVSRRPTRCTRPAVSAGRSCWRREAFRLRRRFPPGFALRRASWYHGRLPYHDPPLGETRTMALNHGASILSHVRRLVLGVCIASVAVRAFSQGTGGG